MWFRKKKQATTEEEKKEIEPKTEELPSVPPLKLWRFATLKDKFIILLAIICSILNGIAQPLMSLIFAGVLGIFSTFSQESIVDPIKAGHNLQASINELCLTFVIIGAVTAFTAYGQMSLWMVAGELQAVRIRHHYYKAILSQEMGWFDSTASGDISSRISGDINLIQEGISEKIGLMIQYFTTFITGFIIAFVKGWKLTLVLLTVVPILAACGVFFSKLIASRASGGQSAYGESGSIAEEVFSSIHTIHSFNSQTRELNRYESKILKAKKDGLRKAFINGMGIGVVMLFLFFTYALGMWYGAKLIAEENYGPDNVIAVFFSVLIGAMSVGQTSSSITALATAQGAASKLFQVIERESKIDPFKCTVKMKNNQNKIGQFKGDIKLNSVKFSYPTRQDITVLDDINLTIDSGTTVALVGPSGSGKSTLVGLIERFYDVDSGSITIDGIDIREVSIGFLRSHIGIVGQEPILFATTIKQNILYGLGNNEQINDLSDQVMQKKVEDVCKLSNIHDFIISLPKGYETQVGEKGSLLSGGQKQRIAIARALIKDPKILLLDEATSALDSESEKLVQTALDNASKNRTTIVIAHRLSTIKNSNKIVVFNRGKIEEEGSHDALLNNYGVYSTLVESQKINTNEENQDKNEDIIISKKITKCSEVIDSKIILQIDNEALDIREKGYDIKKVISNKDSIKEAQKARVELLKKEPLPMLRVLKMASPWTILILIGVIGALVEGSIFPVYSVILTRVSNSFIKINTPTTHNEGINEANFWSLMFVILGIICFVVTNLRVGTLERVGEMLTYEIRLKAFKALLQQEIAFFDDPMNGVGILCSKLSTEAEHVQGLISKVLGPIFMAISTCFVGLGLSFAYGWKLTLVVLACVPVIAIANILQMRMLTNLNFKIKKDYEQVSQIATESIVNIRTVAGLTKENVFFEDYKKRVSKAHKLALNGALKSSFGYSLSMGSPFLINALAFWYGTTLVVAGEYDFLSMFQVITAVIFTGVTLGQTSSQLTTFVKSKVAAIDLFELLDRKPLIDSSEDYGNRPAKLLGNLEFSNAKFHYPTRPNVPILQGFDLSVLAGKHVALVGSSGSGKSTVIALIQRFYDLNLGDLTIEGADIKTWNLPYLRSSMSIVGQEPVLFNISIKENIAYGKPDATDEEIIKAAKIANAHQFIMDQPEGYDTIVGEKGGKVSGGQKQRISIARAVLLEPKLLLLDEATSALDSESEKTVQLALDNAAKDRTTITIAHRLSTIQNCDIIIVMKLGKMVEIGTHEQLLDKHGFYYSLVHQQKLSGNQK